MAVVPPKDKRKDKLLEKDRESAEKDKQIKTLTEALSKAELRTTYQDRLHSPNPTQPTPNNLEYSKGINVPRRNIIKAICLTGAAVGFLGIVGGWNYIFPSTKSTPDPNNPDTWPIRQDMNALQIAQKEIGSLSKYVLPEYDNLASVSAVGWNDLFYKTVEIPREYIMKVFADDVTSSWLPEPYRKGNFQQARGMFYFDRSMNYSSDNPLGAPTGLVEIYDQNNLAGQSNYISFHSVAPSLLLSALEPDDFTDQMLLIARNGSFKAEYSG